MSRQNRHACIQEIDAVCDAFEQDWQAGQARTIEACLDGWDGEPRRQLLKFLVVLEQDYRGREGKSPGRKEYAARFPNDVTVIDEVFQASEPSLDVSNDDTLQAPVDSVSLSDLLNEDARDLIDFLQPPQRPDELGRLAHYRVLEVIGVGGMGVVFRAEDPKLKREVALKVMKLGLAASRMARQRFSREARSAASIDHDNVVTIHEVGEWQKVPYLAMSLLRGTSLKSRLSETGQFDEREIVRIARQMADGLAAAHERGLIHRDIKPDNLWLEAHRERIKILDFGLAHLRDDDQNLTASGMVLGTPKYMSPEQASSEKTDHRSDLFSFGCVLYHMVTGHAPFGGDKLHTTLSAVSRVDCVPIEVACPGLNSELSGLISDLMSKDPDQRPASAEQVIERLDRILEHQNITTPSHAVGGRPPSERGSTWPWIAAGKFAAALVVLFGVVFFLQTDDGTLRVEINDPDVKVRIEGTDVVLTQADMDREITVSPGGQTLTVTRGDFEFTTDKLVIKEGEDIAVRVDWLADRVEVRQGDSLIGSKPLPADERAAPGPVVPGLAANRTAQELHEYLRTVDNSNDREFIAWATEHYPESMWVRIRHRDEILADPYVPADGSLNLNLKTSHRPGQIKLKADEFIDTISYRPETLDATDIGQISNLPLLQILHCKGSGWPSNALRYISNLPNLQAISLHHLGDAFNNESTLELHRFPQLRSLDIGGTSVTDVGLAEIARVATEHLPNLEELLIGIYFEDRTLRHIARIKSLKRLLLSSPALTDQGIVALVDLKLEHLDLYRTPATDETINTLLAMKQLRSVRIRDTNITLAGLARLRQHPSLKELNFHNVKDEAEAKLLHEQLPQIKLLTSHGVFEPRSETTTTDHAEQELHEYLRTVDNSNDRKFIAWATEHYPESMWVRIRHRDEILADPYVPAEGLDLNLKTSHKPGQIKLKADEFIDAISYRLETTTASDVGQISNLPLLQILHCKGSGWPSNALRYISNLPNLQAISLHHLGDAFNDESTLELHRFPQLRSLHIGSTSVTDVGLAEIARVATERLPHLEELVINGLSFKDDGLRDIARIKSLKRLHIGSNVLTDAGIAALQTLELEYLGLYRTPATDETIDTLLQMKQLRSVYIRDTNITLAGLARLRQHPSLEELGFNPVKDEAEAKLLHEQLPQIKLLTSHGVFEPRSETTTTEHPEPQGHD